MKQPQLEQTVTVHEITCYVGTDGIAIVSCPNCKTSKKIDTIKKDFAFRTFKAKCKCGALIRGRFEFSPNHRKKVTEKKILDYSKRKQVTFSLQKRDAKSVYVSGDFCGWDTKKYPMKLEGDRNWTAHIALLEGRYEYKFLIDGQWANDPQNDQLCENCFGTQNNLLNITSK